MFTSSAIKLAGQNNEQSALQFTGAIVQAGRRFIILLMNIHNSSSQAEQAAPLAVPGTNTPCRYAWAA